MSVDLLLLSVVLIWGFNFPITKSVFSQIHPIAFNALRFLISSTAMVTLLRLRGYSLKLDREDIPSILTLGLISNTLYQFLFVLGLNRTKAGNAGLLMAMTPIFAYVIGVFLKHENFNSKILGGILLSAMGVAIVSLAGTGTMEFGATWTGDLLLLSAALCWGGYTAAASGLLVKYGALRLTMWTTLTGTCVLIVLSLPWVFEQNWASVTLAGWLGFGYSTFGAIIYCYLIWSYAISQVGVSNTAVYSNVTPIIALLAGWVLLGEQPTGGQLGGIVCVLTGLFIVRTHSQLPVVLPED